MLSDDEKLNVIAGTTNTIEVPNAQALFMLSIISQSGMGYTDRNKILAAMVIILLLEMQTIQKLAQLH